MKRNPADHDIQSREPYLSIKPNCKWAGIILNNVIVEQGIVYTEKDIQKLLSRWEVKGTSVFSNWPNRQERHITNDILTRLQPLF